MPPKTALNLQFCRAFACHSPEEPSADGPPLFLAADGVHGAVDIDYNGASPASYRNDIIKICLYGKLHVRIPCGEKGSAGTPRISVFSMSFLNLVHVLPMRDANESTSSTGQVNVKFDLNVPKPLASYTADYDGYDSAASGCSKQWSHLPSTLAVRSTSGSDPHGTAQRLDGQASFMVQAQVFRKGEMVGTVSKDIRLFDGVGFQPPTCLSDFPSEYLCEQTDALRKHVFTRVGSFSAVIAEPDPFLFYSGVDFAMTILPIRFVVQGSNVEDCDGEPINSDAAFNATVTWQLKTQTFMSLEPMNFVPTVLQARRTSSITLITTLGRQHKLKLALVGWRRPRRTSAFAGTQEVEKAWTIEEGLALSIPTRCMLAPTFFTPHLSRRYSLMVHVKVAGYGKASVRLEVPVQIVYQKDRIGTGIGACNDNLNASGSLGSGEQLRQLPDANSVSELPAYVP